MKSVQIRSFSGSYFSVFGLKKLRKLRKKKDSVNLRIQPEYSKIRTLKKSIFGNFSRSTVSVDTINGLLLLFTSSITFFTAELNLRIRLPLSS